MDTHGGLGKIISGKIVVIRRERITVDGIEISKEESDRLKEDSRRKLLAAFNLRRMSRSHTEGCKKSDNKAFQKAGHMTNLDPDTANKK